MACSSDSPVGAARLSVFPAFHKVEGRRVVVVGGGAEAAAKVRLLGETSAEIVLIAARIEPDTRAAVAAAGGTVVERAFAWDDLCGAALVFAASGEEARDKAVANAAKLAGVPVNAVDRPEICDFYVGALVNRAPVAVAVSSSGAAPVLARHIRARMEALLPRETGRLAELADGFRSTVSRVLRDGTERRRFWTRFFEGTVADRLACGDEASACREGQRLLNCAASGGFVWLVGAGPGAEDLLTLRAQRVLQEADVIVHDRLVPETVVAMGRRDARRIPVGKAKGADSWLQREIDDLLVRLARDGGRVVRLKSGDPMIFGRAGEEVAALEAAGIEYAIVPGVTAALAAAASAKLPLTLRGVASSVVFATGHDKDGETLPGWAPLALGGTTIAVYMGKTVAGAVAARLAEAGLAAATPAAVVENASRNDESIFGGTLADLARLGDRHDITGPVLIVIGEAVRARRPQPSCAALRTPPMHRAAA